tara:strand:- start:809 stop:1054 length:246 start_codon:yes stop_codon:yes gene_type:complete
MFGKKFAAWKKGSLRFASNTAIFSICLIAMGVGQGCINLRGIKEVEIGIGGFEAEWYEPEKIPFEVEKTKYPPLMKMNKTN